MPALERLRSAGKVRYFGLTERFIHDTQHRMLQRALKDDCWDVIMTGLNVINHSAAERVLVPAQKKNIGTLIMFAVRRALANPEALRDIIADLIERGEVREDAFEPAEPGYLDFLINQGGAGSVIDGAYRFCRHQPGAHVVLTGTGKADHLQQNIGSITSKPLNAACIAKIRSLFGGIDSVSCN